MYQIVLAKRVKKFLNTLDASERERIIRALDKLRIRPEAYLTRLVGEPSYKFRVGDYRLIIDFNKGRVEILVIDIGHRKNIYK